MPYDSAVPRHSRVCRHSRGGGNLRVQGICTMTISTDSRLRGSDEGTAGAKANAGMTRRLRE